MPGGSLDVGGLGFIGRCASWTDFVVQVGPISNTAAGEVPISDGINAVKAPLLLPRHNVNICDN